ncbi:sigma-70 family RNA polymerase sigma factor [Planctomycetales bacterium ZRK34]|nr:sigma-70 family RNA polymerase sigma factor [Planctomycetales bacterium ZRK34]
MPLDHDEAIRVLLNRRGRLLASIFIQTRDMHCAEDVYQDVLLKLIKTQEPFDGPDNVWRWARVVARHATVDLMRQRHRQAVSLQADVLDLLETELDGDPQTPHAEELEALRHCLAAMNPQSRQILELRYRQSLSGVELATRLGRPAKSVYVTMSRLYRKLAECISARVRGEVAGG